MAKKKNKKQDVASQPVKKATAKTDKKQKKQKKRGKLREKLDMYDMILACIFSGNSIIEPDTHLDNRQIAIGFNGIASSTTVTKYYMIAKFPDYLERKFIERVRYECMNSGVRMNFYCYCKPHRILWDSPEMKNRMYVWRKYSEKVDDELGVFDYRERKGDVENKRRILKSTSYLNVAELEHKRLLMSVCFIVEISAYRDDESIMNMQRTIEQFKGLCSRSGIKIKDLRINMIDWLREISPFSLKGNKSVTNKMAKKIMTDDILANFNGYKQGRIGFTGVPLGIDIKTGSTVLRKFKDPPQDADNWLIAAETGGGKSYFVKSLLSFLLADGYVEVIMDYEGDEYLNFANYIRAGNPEDVKVVSMGKKSAVYFDPCEIPTLTGDPDVDDELKELSISFIYSIFRVIVCGVDSEFDKWEESVLSTAVQRMYDAVGVTEDKSTWHRSKGLRLHDVFHEIEEMMLSKELVDYESDNVKHKAATSMFESCKIYFKEGEAKAGTFASPMPADELYRANLVIFSFGMKGAGSNLTDHTLLALKQLCVAYINIQISNHCKYVRKKFNVKVWEEFQRWGEVKGSAETILNAITGGRKRGDINFVITNNLASMMDANNKLTTGIKSNLQNYAIGRIPSKSVRRQFCEDYELMDCYDELTKITKAGGRVATRGGTSTSNNKYKYAFCVVLNDGSKSVLKSQLPPSVAESNLFKT